MILLAVLGMMFSCTPDEPENSDPLNLSIELTISEEETGLIQIQATADNTIEYRFYIDSELEPTGVNTTGLFTYTFTSFGIHQVEVRAYGSSGRYLKETRQVEVSSGQGITLEDGYMSSLTYPGFKLVWYDEFDGNSVNSENWKFETGTGCPNCGWGNNELQYYRRENANVGDGVLVIEARRESYEGSSYTSARMITKGLLSFKYGRVDIRALLPKGQGIWPALWMLGNNISNVGWPACGEIDIMEMVGGSNRENTTHGTIHWDNSGENAKTGGSHQLNSGTYADEYHVFSIIWDEDHIKWLLNDTEFYQVSINQPELSEFHQNFFFIFNVAVGGNWPGNPDGTAIFPQQMKVDYIRVFQNE